jgi:hypothetical protein
MHAPKSVPDNVLDPVASGAGSLGVIFGAVLLSPELASIDSLGHEAAVCGGAVHQKGQPEHVLAVGRATAAAMAGNKRTRKQPKCTMYACERVIRGPSKGRQLLQWWQVAETGKHVDNRKLREELQQSVVADSMWRKEIFICFPSSDATMLL